jgi:osmoprotectant transport system ATP-binding protein
MIAIEGLRKRFPGAASPAVDGISLDVASGEVCVLIGPSGCGKTTTMRMINRMIDPDEGRIAIGGRDIAAVDPVELRRGIGYVIQQVGLFPHLTIAENVATVPRLLGWSAARIAQRVDDLLALVHMDPALYRTRYPRELSGGQKQRVGVARALAADPPLLLMDEPFGALDPLTRAALQDEFLRLLRELAKTIVFVTHDMDEALKLGTRIAVLRDGRVLQYDTPARLLAHPRDAFVESFVGSDRALKRLALIEVAAYVQPLVVSAEGRRVRLEASLRDALAVLLESGGQPLVVVDADGGIRGTLTLESIRGALVAQPVRMSA